MGETAPIPDEMQEKCNRVIEILAKRDQVRKKDLKNTQDYKKDTSAENEKLDYFEQTFTEKYTEIESKINATKIVAQIELADHFNTISKQILTLQKHLAASNIFLKTYSIKKYQSKLSELTVKAKELEDVYLPKKRFGFKNKKKPASNTDAFIDECDFVAPKLIIPPFVNVATNKLAYNGNFCGFRNGVGEIFELNAGEVLKKDVEFNNLQNCTVKLFGAPSTLHMSNLRNCYIFCGPVSTSIFADNCENCTFVIACQQLRLHSSVDVNIYLHVTSRAIIEDCTKICFAPYNLLYKDIINDFNISGLDVRKNHWDDIDDFNWLNSEKKSPNWGLLEKSKVVASWDHMLHTNGT